MGRPRKDPEEPRDQIIGLRVTRSQRALFDACAEAEGKTLSTWIVETADRRAKTIKRRQSKLTKPSHD